MTEYVLPPRFLERMSDLLGEEFPAFEAIYDQPPTHGLRVNTLKLSPAHFVTLSPFSLTPIPWSPAGFLVSDEDRPGKHPYHAAGLYYLQDPHAQAVAEILAPQPGEKVLDLAAAPGGKTTHLASLMQSQGLLVANEIKTRRIGHLAANIERWGARNVAITNETPERLADFFGAFFDRVLVDAPCSGEGMFRKDRAAREDWSEAMIAGCAARQTAILHYAARLARPGGWLCYSTCTFAPEENEAVISRFLDEHREYEMAKTTRLWPHRSPGEGHFIALMRRGGVGAGLAPAPAPARAGVGAGLAHALAPTRAVQSLFAAWCDENLTAPLPVAPTLLGTRVYALPEGLPDLAGRRVVHPGWWLGTVKKNRFEPAHALAMGLRVGDVQRVLALPAGSREVAAYLRGEPLRSDGEEGWLMVAVETPPYPPPLAGGGRGGFPLGWGKRVQGVVKNHYPRGLQWT